MATETLRPPAESQYHYAPATSRQLWLLHILTKTDTRNLNITMAEASKRISELKGNGKRPLVNPHSSAINQDKQKLAQSRYDKKRSSSQRHWGIDTFIVTETSDVGRYGYCSKCFGDMQIFNSDNLVRHYNSHKCAIALGLWGKRH